MKALNILTAVASLALASANTQAVTVVSTAAFNESSLSIVGINGAMATKSETSFLVDTYSPNLEGFKIGSTNDLKSSLNDKYVNGQTLVDATFLGSSSNTDQTSITTIIDAGFGQSLTQREWEIEVSGDGELIIGVEYIFTADILDANDGDAIAFGAAEIYFEGETISNKDDFIVRDTDSTGDEEFLVFFESLSISKPVVDGETLTLVMLTSAGGDNGVTPVPVPASVLLFGTALTGLFGVSRRRKQHG